MASKYMLKYGDVVRPEERDLLSDENVPLERTLVEAAASGNCEEVINLLNSGVSVDAVKYNKLLFYQSKYFITPLQIAAANGHDKCVQILIDHGAKVNAKDRHDATALHMAAEKGNYLCIKALLDVLRTADVSAATKFSRNKDTDGRYIYFATTLPYLGGTTPLHLAAENNHIDCVKELIQYGADYNAVNEKGHTSLYIAAKLGLSECVLTHLRNAIGRDILSLPSNDTYDTPLHFAVYHYMMECVEELLKHGSDVNQLNYSGFSPLHVALSPTNDKILNQLELVKLLVLKGYNADINCPDSRGYLPLHYVCFDGYHNRWARRPELAKFLIGYGANVNIKSTSRTPLLEHELKTYDEDPRILQAVVKGMLQLHPVSSTSLSIQSDVHPRQADMQNLVRPRGLPGSIWDREADNVVMEPPWAENRGMLRIVGNENENEHNEIFVEPRIENAIQRQARQALLRRRVTRFPNDQLMIEVLDSFDDTDDEENQPPPQIENGNAKKKELASPSERQAWYDNLVANPRTLQHHCRYVIRTCMGPKRLKLIKNLHLPDPVMSYLLFEQDNRI